MAKERDMLESWRDLDTTFELCDRAITRKKISEVKRLISSLDTGWYKFNGNFKIYRADVIKKLAKSESEFNNTKLENGIEVPEYEYNDSWRKKQFELFGEKRDALQDILDEINVDDQSKNDSVIVDVHQASLEVKNEIDSIDVAINRIDTEINTVADGKMSAGLATEFKENMARLSSMINQDLKSLVHARLAMPDLTVPELSNKSIKDIFNKKSLDWKNKLNELHLSLAKKTESIITPEPKPTLSSADGSESHVTSRPRETVHLEKTKPPRFDGSELDFPEFQRKWKAQVHQAGLPEESELDKLRDGVPKQAKDMLFGITTLDEAWKILGQRYGNKDLISKKLKEQLKNVTCEGKNDPNGLWI